MKKIFVHLCIALFFLPAIIYADRPTSLVVKVDSRLELFTILEYLGGHLQNVVPSDYESDMKKHFSNYKNHSAVKAVADLMDEKYIESDFPFLSQYFDNVSTMNQMMPITDSVLLGKLKTKNLDQFAALVKDFVVKSNFEVFFAEKESDFMQWQTSVWTVIDQNQFRKKMSQFFGTYKSLTICLSPLMSWEGQMFKPNAAFADSCVFFRLGYSTFKADYSNKDNPPLFNDKNNLEHMIWYEGSLAYINPLVDKNISEFEPARKLFTPELQLKLQKAGAFQWTYEKFLKEQIARGVTAYLMRASDSTGTGNNEIFKQLDLGFIYTGEMVSLFYYYDRERNNYPFIESYFPEVYRFFNSKVQ